MAQLVENLSTLRGESANEGLLGKFFDALNKRRIYKRTYAELANLSSRELDDLGIARSMISRLAHEAAYGK